VSNDPGNLSLSGYAFIASNADALRTALAAAFGAIRDSTYSFTTGSIQAVRTIDENYLYEASFYPLLAPHNDPLWLGYLKRYTINQDGSINTSSDWDAGSILQARAGGDSCSAGRCVYTAIGGSTTAFDKANITQANLGPTVTTDTARIAVIDFIRKGESSLPAAKSENPGWKLGDIFHSQPVTVGTPSAYYYDRVDTLNTPPAYDTFRANHPRSSASGNRLVLAGANDGQLHAFKAGETSAGGGSEVWSFIPPNFLTSLNGIVHGTHPTNLAHQYFVDGPISASDVWLPQWSGSTNAIGTKKNDTDWHTLVVFGERGISNATLWSKVASCDSGFSPTYSATYGYYCGYHALDVTVTTSSPIYKWHFGGSANKLTTGQASYLGSPWSKMILGRVRVSGNEKWVGFVGGGYSSSKSGNLGRSFYVIDLSDGSILWQYTLNNNINMKNALAGPPASVDTDNDGFVDTVYIGDLGNNVWRFKFCTAAQDSSGSCGTSTWAGGLLFQADANSGIRPIYTMPSVARDDVGNLWVYFGTGDVSDPTASNAQERFFAVKDNDRSSTWNANNLQKLQQASDIYGGSGDGWYFNLPGQGIKILADPTVFNGVLYFTAYTPGNANDPCAKGGQADLYAMDYKTGQGMFGNNARSENIGEGIPSAPVVSLNPYGGTDIYVSTSEISGTNNDTAHTQKQDAPTGQNFNKTNLLFWRDMRVQ
jgi:type IV pilus assembly protein PilY1